MSKAEDLANEIYVGDTPITRLRRKDYCDGYHQAEKDLELTVDDIMKIDALLIEMWNNQSENKYQEVLKRFKEMKGNINGE